jgi:hypothetical protein
MSVICRRETKRTKRRKSEINVLPEVSMVILAEGKYLLLLLNCASEL